VVRNSRFLGNGGTGVACLGNNGAPALSSLVQNTFINNKAGTPNNEYQCAAITGQPNYCEDGTCP